MSLRTTVLRRVSHASPASRPVDRNLDFAWLPRFMHRFITWEDDIPQGMPRMAGVSIAGIDKAVRALTQALTCAWSAWA